MDTPIEEAGSAHEAVTTSVARKIEPGREHEFITWTDAGIALIRTFPGFLGAGWMKSTSVPGEYYVVFRFASAGELADWERSPLRKHWLSRGTGVAVQTSTHRLSGIEGWFEPQSNLTNAVKIAPPPKRWKQAASIWMGFFPLSLAINFLVMPQLDFLEASGWELVPRTLIATIINTPIMVYLVLPFITGRIRGWLAR